MDGEKTPRQKVISFFFRWSPSPPPPAGMGIDALKGGPLRRLNSQFQEEFVRNCIKLGCIPNGLGEYRDCAKKDISVEGENKF